MAPKIIPPKPAAGRPQVHTHVCTDAPHRRSGDTVDDWHVHSRDLLPGTFDSTKSVVPDPGDPGRVGSSSDATVKITEMPDAAITPTHGEPTSLEPYRIRSASSLPATNEQGFRIHRGRQYADLAQGGTVLVQQDPVTGIYRATLASELQPSGPELMLDRDTMTWKPAGSSSFELPEAALIERLYKGRDDEIERQIKSQGYTMSGRGITSFNPVQQKVIIEALATVQQTLGHAVGVANQMPGWSKQVVAKTIGEGDVYFARVVDAWKAVVALCAQYREPSGLARFVCVDNPFNVRVHGFIRSDDNFGRVFLVGEKVSRGMLFDITLAHELSHLGEVHEVACRGPATVDYVYLSHDLKNRTPSALALAKGELTDAQFDSWPAPTSQHFVRKVNELTNPVHSLPHAVEVFNQDPRVRAEILSTTADIVAFCAFQLSSAFKAERARQQAKRKAPTE